MPTDPDASAHLYFDPLKMLIFVRSGSGSVLIAGDTGVKWRPCPQERQGLAEKCWIPKHEKDAVVLKIWCDIYKPNATEHTGENFHKAKSMKAELLFNPLSVTN